MESRWSYVRQLNTRGTYDSIAGPKATASEQRKKLTVPFSDSYNRYLAVAARVVRRSLKEDKRLIAERRGEMDLRFSKWQVRRHEIRRDDRATED